MRVLLADDNTKVRSALRLLLEQLKKVEVVEEVSNAEDLAARLECLRCGGRPDLLLLDWELPGLHPGGAIAELCQRDGLKVIILSGRCQAPQEILAPLADAFISKYEHPDHLVAALQAVGAD